MTIGADPTINPEIILQGLASTDPSLLTSEINQSRQVNNQTAMLPADIALKQAQAANEQAMASYNQMLVNSWSGLSQARKTTKQQAESAYTTTPQTTALPPPVQPQPPASGVGTWGAPESLASPATPPLTDNAESNVINNDNEYSTGLES